MKYTFIYHKIPREPADEYVGGSLEEWSEMLAEEMRDLGKTMTKKIQEKEAAGWDVISHSFTPLRGMFLLSIMLGK